MKKFVNRYVDGCDICHRTKAPRHAPYGPLRPLPIPEKPWSDITYDLITNLPSSMGYTAILVVVDRFTKGGHFIPTYNEVTAEGVADLFLEKIWSQHGLPVSRRVLPSAIPNNFLICHLRDGIPLVALVATISILLNHFPFQHFRFRTR